MAYIHDKPAEVELGTMNPLYQPKPSLQQETTPQEEIVASHDSCTAAIVKITCLVLVLFIIPISLVWVIDIKQLYDEKPLILTTVFLTCPIVLERHISATLLQRVNARYRTVGRVAKLKRLGTLIAFLGVGIFALGITSSFVGIGKVVSKTTSLEEPQTRTINHGNCSVYTPETMPKEICRTLYRGNDRFFGGWGPSKRKSKKATYVSNQGMQSIISKHRDVIISAITQARDTFADILDKEALGGYCYNVLSELFCRMLIFPCNKACNIVKLNGTECKEKMSNECEYKLTRLSKFPFDATEIKRSLGIFLEDGPDKESIIESVGNQYGYIYDLYKKFKSKDEFCSDEYMFFQAGENVLNAHSFEEDAPSCRLDDKKNSRSSHLNSLQDDWDRIKFRLMQGLVTLASACATVRSVGIFLLYKRDDMVQKRTEQQSTWTSGILASIIIPLFTVMLFAYKAVDFLLAVEQARTINSDTRYSSLGVAFMTMVILLVNVFISLFGKMWLSETGFKRTKRRPLVVKRMKRIWRKKVYMFNFYNGPYFFHRIIVGEIYELIIQLTAFDRLAKTNDVMFVMLASALISLNLICTPVLMMVAVHNAKKSRVALYVLDASLDAMFAILNVLYMEPDDLLNLECILALLPPAGRTIFAMKTLSKYRTYIQMYKHDGRRRSLIEFVTNTDVQNRADQEHSGDRHRPDDSSSEQRVRKGECCKLKYVKMATVVISPLLFVIGTVFIIYMVGNAIAVTHQCEELLGKSLWEVATPRQVFHDGLFEPPECHFHTITAIEAPGKDITHLTPAIGDLVSLQTLDLRDNRIIHLPIEISKLKMDVLRDVKLDGNPVFTSLDWSNKGINTFPKILHEHFRGLKYLDLSNNKLQRLPSQVSLLDDLETLDLRNNTISRDGLPHGLYLMQRLHKRRGLSVTNNPVHTQLTLHGVKADDSAICIDFVKTYFGESMVDLDVSKSEFEAGDFHSILESMDALTSLNISHNRIKSLFSLQKSGNRLDMLDLSGNPIADIRLLFFRGLEMQLYGGNKIKDGTVFFSGLQSSFIAWTMNQNKTFVARDLLLNFPHRTVKQFFRENEVNQFVLSVYVNHYEDWGLIKKDVGRGNSTLMDVSFLCEGAEHLQKLQFTAILGHSSNSITYKDQLMAPLSCISKFRNLIYFRSSFMYFLGNNDSFADAFFALPNLEAIETTGGRLFRRIPQGIHPNSKLKDISITNHGLGGSLPDSISNMKHLTRLDLSRNSLSGEVPATLSALVKLTELYLRYNYKLRGSLNFTTNLKSLVFLELTHNNFTGRLPNGISNLKPLSRLMLGGNDLEGEVPNGVTRLTRLTQLYLGGNRLHGKIDFITVLTRVKWLTLEINAFTGTVPSKISNLKDLLSLKLGKNKLHGNLNFITNLKSLQTLELGYNNFTGKLPNGISKLTRLSSLRLRVNNLAGEVPQKLTRLTKMTQLHVGGNRFHGGIAFITALTRMQYLNLEANAFTGPVPSKISSFRYLIDLRLGRNNFTGELPFGISSLTKLTTLSVEKNPLLHGNITRITSSLSKLDYLNITMTSMLT